LDEHHISFSLTENDIRHMNFLTAELATLILVARSLARCLAEDYEREGIKLRH
jgi:hypothetical protein